MFIVLIRTIVLYLLIIVGIRLLGKRQVGELEPSELVLALIIADLASVPMQDNGIPLSAGVIPIVTLLAVATILSLLTVRFLRFRALLCGKPSIVVENGVVQESELRKNRVTIDELCWRPTENSPYCPMQASGLSPLPKWDSPLRKQACPLFSSATAACSPTI